MAMPKPRFETFEGVDEQWYARIKARNGRILFSSEGYVSPDGAADAIFTLIGIVQAVHYDIVLGEPKEESDERTS
jgi:uncharacterized protein YegP (UPF0339 family)